MSLAIRGNDFLKFVGVNEAILELVDRKWTQKLTLFAKSTFFEGSFLANLGVEKVVFWTFSKLFGSCLGTV